MEHKNTHILNRKKKKENHLDEQSKLWSKPLLGQSTCGDYGKRVSGHASKKGSEEWLINCRI